jgi:hypothetical protein
MTQSQYEIKKSDILDDYENKYITKSKMERLIKELDLEFLYSLTKQNENIQEEILG